MTYQKGIPLDILNRGNVVLRPPATVQQSLEQINESSKQTAIGSVQGLSSNFQIYKVPREVLHGGNQVFEVNPTTDFPVEPPLRIITRENYKRYFLVRNLSPKVLTYFLYITNPVIPFNSTVGTVTTNPVSMIGVKDAEVHLFNYALGVLGSVITLNLKAFATPRTATGITNYYDPSNDGAIVSLGNFNLTAINAGISVPLLRRWTDPLVVAPTQHLLTTVPAIGFTITASGGAATSRFLILAITLTAHDNGYLRQNDIYFAGDATVSGVNGITLHNDEEYIFTIEPNDELWAIGAALNDTTHNNIASASTTLPNAFDLFSPGGIGANLPFIGHANYAFGGNSNNTVQVVELR